MKTTFLRLLAAGLSGLSSLAPAAAAPAPIRPNFVVFITDDHSLLDAEPYGARDVRTPHMARLASEGLKFTHVFAASPTCGPSRTALFTGLWPARNGAEPNHKPKRPDVAGLPTTLRALGYEVVAIGKVAHNNYATDYEFDFAVGPDIGSTNADELAKYLARRDPQRPLCLFFGTHYPHTPWIENQGYDPSQLKLPPTFVDTPMTREQRARYYSSITAADALLGEVRALTQKHVPGDTLFVLTADQGGAWPFAKWDLYEASTRVPFIAVWPGHLKPGSTSDAMICLPDLLPTFIELAGGKVPGGLDGRSFAGVLQGKTHTHRDRAFATCSGDGDFNVYPSRSLRTRDWKYILNLHPEFQHHTHISRSQGPMLGIQYWRTWLEAAKHDPAAAVVVKRYSERPAEELYDLRTDPHEQRNLAADPIHATRLAEMRAEVRAWMKAQGDLKTVFGKPLLIGEPVVPVIRTQPPGPPKAQTK